MRKTELLILLFSFIVSYGCHRNSIVEQDIKQEIARLKNEAKEDPHNFTVHMTSMYDPDLGCINRKDRLWQDMKFEPKSLGAGNLYYDAFFFNYGGNVKLFNGYVNDCYVPLGKITYMMHIEDMHSLWMKEIIHDEKYGSYALVDWKMKNGVVSDVLMTPMAYHAYQTRSGDENIIFVQFQGGDKYMNVIFCGGEFERIIVNYSPESINNGFFIGEGKNGHGQFWH